MEEFEVLPRLRLRGGAAVRADGTIESQPETVTVINRLLADEGRVLLWDLDGIERNRPRLDILRRFEGDAVWVDAGVRTAESVIDVLVAGAEKAVVGTKTLRGLDDLDEARDLSDDIVVQVDIGTESRPELGGWTARRYLEWSRDARLDACLIVGEEAPPVVDVPNGSVSVYVGLARPADFAAMQSRGYRGAIVDGSEAAAWRT